MARIAVIDYGAGNLRSVVNSLRAVASAGDEIALVDKAGAIGAADRVVLPGVGAYHECKNGLAAIDGMIAALDAFRASGKPFLGICVGMQLLHQEGEEHGITTQGLGWLTGRVERLKPSNPALKIPHMGWNDLTLSRPHLVLDGLDGKDVYFVHSYSAHGVDDDEVLASADYGGAVVAAVGKENVLGTQFHPEKSQEAGLRLLQNFLNWQP